jgi:hypothetical protein
VLQLGTDTSTSCSKAGLIRWNGTSFQGCYGTTWADLTPLRIGQSASLPGLSCKAILGANASVGDGVYWVKPDGASGGLPPYQTYCDMTNGGWTLVMSSMLPWSSAGEPHFTTGSPYTEMTTLRPTNRNTVIVNAAPFSSLTSMRFTCYAAATSTSYGVDWSFNLSDGSNRAILGDIYDDGALDQYQRVSLTLVQSNGTQRSTGWDDTTYRDWGLGSSSGAAYWSSEAWGEVDSQGGHCQDPGVSYTTTPLSGTGQFHIWVK